MENLDLKQFNIKFSVNPANPIAVLNTSELVESDGITKNRRKQDVLTGIERLPTLPKIVDEVIRLANDPRS